MGRQNAVDAVHWQRLPCVVAHVILPVRGLLQREQRRRLQLRELSKRLRRGHLQRPRAARLVPEAPAAGRLAVDWPLEGVEWQAIRLRLVAVKKPRRFMLFKAPILLGTITSLILGGLQPVVLVVALAVLLALDLGRLGNRVGCRLPSCRLLGLNPLVHRSVGWRTEAKGIHLVAELELSPQRVHMIPIAVGPVGFERRHDVVDLCLCRLCCFIVRLRCTILTVVGTCGIETFDGKSQFLRRSGVELDPRTFLVLGHGFPRALR